MGDGDAAVDRTIFAEFIYEPSPVAMAAIHAGHHLPDEARPLVRLSEDVRLREEDPFTDRLAALWNARILCHHSRFAVDLNRPRDRAIYRTPEEAWGLDVWTDPEGPPERVARRSLEAYDRFYTRAERFFRRIEHDFGRFVVLDLHSYNHRRDGPGAPPADPAANPEINVGTGSLDRSRWSRVVERFMDVMASPPDGGRLDVRENVRFRGGHFVQWLHETFPETGCGLAVEFKKTFMDEWTGALHSGRLRYLGRALVRSAEEIRAVLEEGAPVEGVPGDRGGEWERADSRRTGESREEIYRG